MHYSNGAVTEAADRPVPLHHFMFWLTSGAAAWVTIAVAVAWLIDLRLPLLP